MDPSCDHIKVNHSTESQHHIFAMSFEPKQKVELDPPKDDPISLEYLSKCDGGHSVISTSNVYLRLIKTGTQEGYPTYVAIKVSSTLSLSSPSRISSRSKGTVFDVTGNKAYGPDGGYKVFAGKDASRALAQSSLKPEGVSYCLAAHERVVTYPSQIALRSGTTLTTPTRRS